MRRLQELAGMAISQSPKVKPISFVQSMNLILVAGVVFVLVLIIALVAVYFLRHHKDKQKALIATIKVKVFSSIHMTANHASLPIICNAITVIDFNIQQDQSLAGCVPQFLTVGFFLMYPYFTTKYLQRHSHKFKRDELLMKAHGASINELDFNYVGFLVIMHLRRILFSVIIVFAKPWSWF